MVRIHYCGTHTWILLPIEMNKSADMLDMTYTRWPAFGEQGARLSVVSSPMDQLIHAHLRNGQF